MEIKISKKDENIYIEYNEVNEILNFESLKKISRLFLNKKINNENIQYSINTNEDSSLEIYKNTVKDVIDKVIGDDELINLFKSNKNNQSN